jgi:hypothetical protein
MSDEIANEVTHRILKYVDLAASAGTPLTEAQFESYAEHPDRQSRNVMPMSILETVRTETMMQYLGRLGWLEIRSGHVRLTPLGQLVRKSPDSSAEATSPSRLEVVIDPSDPLNYANVINTLAGSGAGLLVDPYFGADQLRDIATHTDINRVLMMRWLPSKELARFTLWLGALGDGAPEVRTTKPLHDRMVIPDSGGVTTIGVSLNGVHKHITVLTTLSADASSALRAAFETIWSQADVLPPTQPASEMNMSDPEVMVELTPGPPDD